MGLNSDNWLSIKNASWQQQEFATLLPLMTRLLKERVRGVWPERVGSEIRLAFLADYSIFPLAKVMEHFLLLEGYTTSLFEGGYNSLTSQAMTEDSELDEFKPAFTVLLPASPLPWKNSKRDLLRWVRSEKKRLLDLCRQIHHRTRSEIVLCNFLPSPFFDFGSHRVNSLSSHWNAIRSINLELSNHGLSHVHICDLEFLASRVGTLRCFDEKNWYELKQPYDFDFVLSIAKECTEIILKRFSGNKKVLVLDLDNTLWGGVVGERGLEGIELGDTSPIGEAFKDFQKYVKALSQRGVLLAVASKNDALVAKEVFLKHPEMVLSLDDIVCFHANWKPKHEGVRCVAEQLSLSLSDIAFVDDSPIEIDEMNHFLPEVETLCLGRKPQTFIRRLMESRWFRASVVTTEDRLRKDQYIQETTRLESQEAFKDYFAYLKSLEMKATIRPFESCDIARITQLTNKCNQFNLTTIRRTESECTALMNDSRYIALSIRLADKFGDHGLISVLILKLQDNSLEVDTWLMSCRVLGKDVEVMAFNEIVKIAQEFGLSEIRGYYRRTARNAVVEQLYPKLGFSKGLFADSVQTFHLMNPEHCSKRQTAIQNQGIQ